MTRDPRTGAWSAPSFVRAKQASLGLQIGGKESFVVILFMNTNTITSLASGDVSFGGEASGTAGNSSSGAGGTVSSTEPATLIYSDAAGLYGGAAVKGGNIAPDLNADLAYYGQYVSPEDILFGRKVAPSGAAAHLGEVINQYSK
jgi:lipid-binding SYLF domain-containing protein